MQTTTTRHTATAFFTLALAMLAIGNFPLALAFGAIAAGFAPRTRQTTVLGLAFLALLLLAGGYTVGKDMAHRDNARSAVGTDAP